jgi:hypothetical protein
MPGNLLMGRNWAFQCRVQIKWMESKEASAWWCWQEKSIMSDSYSSPSKHVLNATLLHKGNTVTAILSSGRQLLSLPIPPQVQYHESVMSTLAQCDHLKCIWNPKSPNQPTEHQLKRAEVEKLLNIPIQLVCIMQHDNAFVFCSCKQTSHIDS